MGVLPQALNNSSLGYSVYRWLSSHRFQQGDMRVSGPEGWREEWLLARLHGRV